MSPFATWAIGTAALWVVGFLYVGMALLLERWERAPTARSTLATIGLISIVLGPLLMLLTTEGL